MLNIDVEKALFDASIFLCDAPSAIDKLITSTINSPGDGPISLASPWSNEFLKALKKKGQKRKARANVNARVIVFRRGSFNVAIIFHGL